ncbi:hypothetical protein SAMN02745127_03111 [Oceanospirillum multiglobuliferum]|uniref:DUF5681 domain-containing protein n=1 Tax=Oceanospirillum multiglobuliferum TaxID=64969 RepID=A0A1T4SJU4_9GAMM|nr:DUF5681 domain-containing protein [Oceanospirillum multiglobuliferum]OPX54136.1 hypothetical protein BTE48_15725 [Oceanospirillum multiglobuliferum]SKA28121.1 hypothetical protein SAMN02745127_03111 [Oceanospirillum multiglobuliferum]
MPERNQGRFKKGVSGNPQGRPRKATTELEKALKKHGADLADKLIALALEGDTTALKICIDRIHAPLKPQSAPVQLELPEGASMADTGRAILNAVARGELPTDQASQMLNGLGALVRVIELEELEQRIQALEDRRQ